MEEFFPTLKIIRLDSSFGTPEKIISGPLVYATRGVSKPGLCNSLAQKIVVRVRNDQILKVIAF